MGSTISVMACAPPKKMGMTHIPYTLPSHFPGKTRRLRGRAMENILPSRQWDPETGCKLIVCNHSFRCVRKLSSGQENVLRPMETEPYVCIYSWVGKCTLAPTEGWVEGNAKAYNRVMPSLSCLEGLLESFSDNGHWWKQNRLSNKCQL